MFKLSFHNTILRFYLMMLVAIIAVYTAQAWLIVVAFAVGVGSILGYQINFKPAKTTEAKRIDLQPQPRRSRKAG